MQWIRQAEEMVGAWSRVQAEMWEKTLEALRQGKEEAEETKGAAAAALGRMAEIWRESVLKALQAQVEWTRIWTERLAEQSEQQELADSARRFQSMVERWAALQQNLWEGWFDAASKVGPKIPSSAIWLDLMKEWQQAAAAALQAQADWARAWTEKREEEPKEPGSPRTSASPGSGRRRRSTSR